MNTTKSCRAGILLAIPFLCTICGVASAQTWKARDVWQDDQPAPTKSAGALRWEQRVLKQPQLVAQQQPMEVIPPGATESDPPAEGVPVPSNVHPQRTIIHDGDIGAEMIGNASAGCDTCGDDSCGCDTCGTPERGRTCEFGYEIFDGRCGRWLRDFSFFTGVDAFKGPRDHGSNGNFGMNAGLNLAGPLGDPWGCGYQIGVNFVGSNFSGAPVVTTTNYTLNAADRKQTFLTAGLFRRSLCRGFQYGVAFDYLRDDYYQKSDLSQIRSETGFVCNDEWEIGYYGVYGVSSERAVDGKLDPTDMFILYVRRYFENGGEGRIWGGGTGNGDGLVGADLWVPLGKGFALENRVNYMIPKQGTGTTAQPRESWGLVIQLVWYPGQDAKCMKQNPFRAMFNVADNSLFMVDRLAQ